MNLFEKLTKSFLEEPKTDNLSSVIDVNSTKMDFDDTFRSVGFFDNDPSNFNKFNLQADPLSLQNNKILQYRTIAANPDVEACLDEITNEIAFSHNSSMPLKLHFLIDNEKIQDAVNERFNRLMNIMKIRKNIYPLIKSTYIDGQIILHCAYDEKNKKNGISRITLVDPRTLVYDNKEGVYKSHNNLNHNKEKSSYSKEEIIIHDFGLKYENINLSYLEYAIKSSNQLKALEDLLVPLRFSRSVSRRIFNIDVGNLSHKNAAEYMKDIQKQFAYKKFYNSEDGTISNQQHIVTMVEDYWFGNKSGERGVQVDTLDETGNLGELDDIIYANKKLYKSMKVPISRISIDPNANGEFDFESTNTSKEDIKFFMFTNRIRMVYSEVFKELLRRDVIYSGIMSEGDWLDIENNLNIVFERENHFIEKMDLENYKLQVDSYTQMQEQIGKLFPASFIIKKIFKLSDDEIKEMHKEIEKESKSKEYAKIYQTEV